MDCAYCEEKLSEYLEQNLPAEEAPAVAQHLENCANCSALIEEMQSILIASQKFPALELDDNLLERILLRTSGRPRTRKFRELMEHFILHSLLTPRFAAGAVLATFFFLLLVNLLVPRVAEIASILSPLEIFRQLDRGVQQVYSKGLQAYDATNEWQARISFYKSNMFNKLGFMMEQLDVPVEGKIKPGNQQQRQQKAPDNKNSMLLLRA
jgi:hypothetical protein